MPRKGTNIYKRKDHRWEARYIKEYKEDGKPLYGYCYGKTYKEAKTKMENARIQLTNGQNKQDKKKLFSLYCDEWLKVNRTHIKESTYAKYYNVITKYIKPRLGSFLIQNLSTVNIEQFSYDLLYIDNLSSKTVKDILAIISSILKYVQKHYSDVSNIEIIYPKTIRKDIRILTKVEQLQFITYLLDDMDSCKFGVLLTLLTGMRIGEICALKWENISLEDKTIFIKSTMLRLKNFDTESPRKTKIVISDPKSYTSMRIIPLTDLAYSLCEQFHVYNKNAFVLTGKEDKFIEPRLMQYKLNKYTKECGLENIHFHTLRHTFATRCVEVDFEIKSLSQILGHSSPKVTLERYVHTSLELKRSNMEKLTSIGL